MCIAVLMATMGAARSQDVSPSTPGTSDNVAFNVHLDPCPYDDDAYFYVVVTDLNDTICALGYGAGSDGAADIWTDASAYGAGYLADGIYGLWVGSDPGDTTNDTALFPFVVLTSGAQFDSVSATSAAASVSASAIAQNFPDSGLDDALEFNDWTDFNIDLMTGTTTTINVTFLNILPANDFGFSTTGALMVESSLDGQNYTNANVLFDMDSNSFFIENFDLSALDDGPHVLYIRATDLAWNTTIHEYWFVTDNTPPIVTWYDENGNLLHDGDTVTNQALCVTGAFWDAVGLPNISASYGTSITCTAHNLAHDWGETIYVSTWNTSTATFFIASGEYDFDSVVLTATITDLAGNIATSSITVYYALAPTVIAVSPIGAQWVTTSTPDIYAIFSLSPGGTLTNQTLTIDGEAVDSYINGPGVYATNPHLSDGAHTISVIAGNYVASYFEDLTPEDGDVWAYNTFMMPAAYSWTVNVDTVAPTIVSATVTDGIVTLTPSDDTSGVSYIEFHTYGCGPDVSVYALNGNPATMDVSAFDPGWYLIAGSIIDNAGNSYRFTATIAMPDGAEGDAEVDGVAQDTTVQARIYRTTSLTDPPLYTPNSTPVFPKESAWVGEKIRLYVVLVGTNSLIETSSWDLNGGRAVRDYYAARTSGEATPLTHGGNGIDSNLDSEELIFYWWDKRTQDETISCHVTFDDATESRDPSVSFAISKPTCEFSFETGTIFYVDNPNAPYVDQYTGIQMFYDTRGPRVALGGPILNKNTPVGIVVNPTISNFKSTADKWATTQVITADNDDVGDCSDAPTGTKKHAYVEYSASMLNSIKTGLLDFDPNKLGAQFPLSKLDPLAKPIGADLEDFDGPRETLKDIYSELECLSEFDTYVMYRPDGDDNENIYVPLKVCSWYVSKRVDRNYHFSFFGNIFKIYDFTRGAAPPWGFLPDSNASEFDSFDPTQFPTWYENFPDNLLPELLNPEWQ
ncbi:MAG TPA: hypothetical protein VKX17_11325 [Planctomycetota bacterium]|nr:hypothetical protein [Planctomycetota bacterium]